MPNYVVYNTCYGGFSLSRQAAIRMAELGFKWPSDIREALNNPEDTYYGIDLDDVPRHHPILVQVVRELGEQANGSCAELAIYELPPNTPYRVNEYDGWESVIIPSDLKWIDPNAS